MLGVCFFFERLGEVTKEKTEELLNLIPPEFREKVRREFLNNVVNSTPQIMESLYKKIKKGLDKYEVELIKSSNSENFVIGDSPIINDKKAFKESEFMMLPLSGKYMIGIAMKKGVWSLSTKHTRMLKKKVKKSSYKYWFCLP